LLLIVAIGSSMAARSLTLAQSETKRAFDQAKSEAERATRAEGRANEKAREASGNLDLAKRKASEAEGSLKSANEQRALAQREAKKAQNEKSRADAELASARQAKYTLAIGLAERQWRDNNLSEAERLLTESPNEYRNWEWHYLNRLVHPESVEFDGGRLYPVAFSPDGRLLAAATIGKTRVWHVESRDIAYEIPTPKNLTDSLAFDLTGKLLAIAVQDGTVLICSAIDGKILHTIQVDAAYAGAGAGEFHVAFDPKGKRLGVANSNRMRNATVWNTDFGQLLFTLSGHLNPVDRIEFSRNGRWIATGCYGEIHVWDARSGKRVHKLAGAYRQFDFRYTTNDLVALATTMDDVGDRSTIEIIDLDSKRVKSTSTVNRSHQLSCFTNGRFLAIRESNGMVVIRDMETWVETIRFRIGSATYQFAISPEGDWLATSGRANSVKLWPIKPRQVRANLRYQTLETALIPSRNQLVAAQRSQKATIAEIESLQPISHLTARTHQVNAVAVSKNDSMIAIGGHDGLVQVFSAADESPLVEFKACASYVKALAFSAEGDILATSSGSEHEIHLWNVSRGTKIRTLATGIGCESLVFIPGQRRLAGSGTPSVTVWDADTGQTEWTDKSLGFARCVQISPDNRVLAVGGQRDINLYDSKTGTKLGVLRGGEGDVYSVAFSPDSQRLFSGDDDGAIRVWDTRSFELLLVVRADGDMVMSVNVTPDGNRVVTADHSGVVSIWDATPISHASEEKK
jgi:WD40 repeat protein